MSGNELVIKIIVSIVFLAVLSVIANTLAGKLLSGKWKVKSVSFALALVLTVMSVLFLQSKSVFPEEAAVAKLVAQVKDLMPWGDAKEQGFVDRNFVFVNTTFNQQLTVASHMLAEDSAVNVITDRGKLTRLLQHLNAQDSLVGLVACDLLFTDQTPDDSLLLEQLLLLQQKNKLVLAYNPDMAASYPVFYNSFQLSSLGDVTLVKGEDAYFSHNMIGEAGTPGFAYQMYAKLRRVTPERAGPFIKEGSRYAFPAFIPELVFTDEQELYRVATIGRGDRIMTTPDTALVEVGPENMYTLGRSVTADGWDELVAALQERSHQQVRPVVFIGSLGDDYIDRHATAYGTLYGATLLLNEFYYFTRRFHLMHPLTMITYVLVLLLFFWWIFYQLVRQALKKEVAYVEERRGDFWGSIGAWWKVVSEFVLAERHFLLLFLLVFVIDIFFHKLLNLMILLYFFVPFSALLKFCIKMNNKH